MAPAILAGGLVAGEYTYRQQAGAVTVTATFERAAFEPVVAPAPPHPDKLYEGVIPAAIQPVEVETVRHAVPVVENRSAPVEHVQPQVRQRPVVRRRVGCPGEWRETWLWELCREHERHAMQEGP
ncbi:hypothetical protein [Thermoactinospora rubra]|uniref:hypothetical protein n=1 Tax=Thermoactinospora rubra TaxID=1088767 RepID=UPI000A0F48FB|nr:hypothetical protein [Thermoactinospora rubra]